MPFGNGPTAGIRAAGPALSYPAQRRTAGLATVLLALLLGGCGDQGDPIADPLPSGTANASTSAEPQSGKESEPPLERDGPDDPAPKVDRPYAQLPTLPAGSNDNSTDAVKKTHCMKISMLGGVDDGVSVKVTGIRVDRTDVVKVSKDRCRNPSCWGFTFTADDRPCYLAVVPLVFDDDTGEQDARLSLSGDVRCKPGAERTCAAFVSDVKDRGGSTIALFPPQKSDDGGSGGSGGGAASPQAESFHGEHPSLDG